MAYEYGRASSNHNTMAYEFLSSPFFLSLLLLILLLKSIKLVFSKRVRLPPSPWKLPLIGNLHRLGSQPHLYFHKLAKKHGPLMLVKLGQVPTLVVSSSEMAREVMKTHDLNFASRPHIKAVDTLFYGNLAMAFGPYGDYWRQMRKICVTNLLSVRRVQSFHPSREDEVADFMDKIVSQASSSPSEPLNMSHLFYCFTNDMLCRAIMGKLSRDEGRNDTFREIIEESFVLVSGFCLEDFFPSMGWLSSLLGLDERFKRNFRKWDAVLSQIIQEHLMRRKEGNLKDDSFAAILLSLQKDPNTTGITLTNDNIKVLLLDMVSAGTHTTYITLEWSMAELIKNPQVMKKLQNEVRGIARGKSMLKEEDLSEMHYLKAVIKETLRLHPPGPLLLPRQTIESCEIEGYHIPGKTNVLINFWTIGRDPKFWGNNADEFQPERFVNSPIDFKGLDYEFIPFGAGRRVCPGLQFAASTLQLALANLVNRFDWKLPDYVKDEKEFDMTESPGTILRMKKELYLVPEPRF